MVRSGDDAREAQLRMIRDGEAMPVDSVLSLNDEPEEGEALAGQQARESAEDEQE